MEKKRKGLSAGGILTVLALVLVPLAIGVFLMPGGGGSGNYSSYAGPVLPMTAVRGGENLEVRRNVNFDLSAYEQERKNGLDTGAAVITDTYELTNTTPESVTVELAYGFEGQFTDPAEQFPAISVDGQPLQTEILASVDTDGALHRADSWDAYKKELTETDHLAAALTPAEVPEIPVTVVRLSGFRYTLPDSAEAVPVGTDPVFVGAEFAIPEGTTVWTPHFHMTRQEDGLWQVYSREEVELYFVGAAPEEIRPVANIGYNVRENTILTVQDRQEVRFASALTELLHKAAMAYDFWAENEGYPDPGFLTPERLFQGALKRIAHPDYRYASGEIRAMSGVFYDVVSEIRMLYRVFEVTVPAGETVTVEAVFTQEASYDFGGPKKYREGYDMATTLGSNLNFTEQTSSLTGWEFIEIVKQNFGFDLRKEITEVKLDLAVERYYLDVRAK